MRKYHALFAFGYKSENSAWHYFANPRIKISCISSLHSLVPRPYFFLLLSLFIHKSQERHSASEMEKNKEMGVRLRPGLGNRVVHKDFYECGRYVAHNHDDSPTHSELIRLYCTETQPPSCAASQIREPAWPALVAVATCYMIMMT